MCAINDTFDHTYQCKRINKSSPNPPPTPDPTNLFTTQSHRSKSSCFSTPRWLHFLEDESSWQGLYDYYHDAMCREPSFSLKAKGSYVGGTDSTLVKGSKHYSFKVTRLKVIPHDQATVNSLNHYDGTGCGKAHAWKIGQEQDVTRTGGCVTLGIRLPNMEEDLMKMQVSHRKLHLYVGQRLRDRKAGTAYQRERPTAFQEPLVKCDQTELDMNINTVPHGGHSWAGPVALPLLSGPDDWQEIIPSSASRVCCFWPGNCFGIGGGLFILLICVINMYSNAGFAV